MHFYDAISINFEKKNEENPRGQLNNNNNNKNDPLQKGKKRKETTTTNNNIPKKRQTKTTKKPYIWKLQTRFTESCSSFSLTESFS
jgi:hypothetical protein